MINQIASQDNRNISKGRDNDFSKLLFFLGFFLLLHA